MTLFETLAAQLPPVPPIRQRTVALAARSRIAELERLDDGKSSTISRLKLIEDHIIGPYGEMSLVRVGRDTLLRQKFRLFKRSSSLASAVVSEWREVFKLARRALWLTDAEIPAIDRLPRPPGGKAPKQRRMEKTAQQALTLAELGKLAAVAEGENRLILVLAFGLALRQQDFRGAYNRAIVFDHARCRGRFIIEFAIDRNERHTTVTKTPKGSRSVKFGKTIYDELAPLMAERADPDAFLIGNGKRFVGNGALNNRFKALCLAAGVTRTVDGVVGPRTVAKCPLQMARRIGASIWLDAGTPTENVRKDMGHAREDTSVSWYYVDQEKIKARPAPAIVPQHGRSFFKTAMSSTAAEKQERRRAPPRKRASDKVVSRAARAGLDPRSYILEKETPA